MTEYADFPARSRHLHHMVLKSHRQNSRFFNDWLLPTPRIGQSSLFMGHLRLRGATKPAQTSLQTPELKSGMFSHQTAHDSEMPKSRISQSSKSKKRFMPEISLMTEMSWLPGSPMTKYAEFFWMTDLCGENAKIRHISVITWKSEKNPFVTHHSLCTIWSESSYTIWCGDLVCEAV